MTADSLPDSSVPDVADNTPSAGAMLRAHREASGLKPDALAKALRVPLSKLQALEADRLDALPDAMFARALALAICRHLKVDAAPVLARLPQQDVSRLAARDERGLDFPLQRPSLLPTSGWYQLVDFVRARWAVCLLALVVLWVVWSWRDSNAPVVEGAVELQPAAVVTTPVVSPAVEVAPTTPGETVHPTEAAPAHVRHVITPVQSTAVVLTPVVPAATASSSK